MYQRKPLNAAFMWFPGSQTVLQLQRNAVLQMFRPLTMQLTIQAIVIYFEVCVRVRTREETFLS